MNYWILHGGSHVETYPLISSTNQWTGFFMIWTSVMKELIAKLQSYGFDKNSLYFINSYLKGRKQRTKINSSYSEFFEILFGVHQVSILGPLPFSIYICDLFFESCNIDIANYADDNTPYPCLSIRPWIFFKLFLNFGKTPKDFLDGFITIT